MMIWLLVYIVLSTIVSFFLSKGNKREWLFKWIIVIFLPIIGWFFPFIWPRNGIPNKADEFEAYMDGQIDDIPVELMASKTKIERERELNVISIEDALLMSDYSTRRRIMIDVLKQDALQYLDVLKTAVTNDDTETSHYAVTAVIEVKRELTLLLQKLSVEFSQTPNDQQLALTYASVIKEYLRSGFLDEQSIKQYRITYTQILQQLINSDQADEDVFVEKLTMELALGDVHSAEQTALLFKARYPMCEKAYLSLMEIHYEMRAFEKLEKELNNLIATPITLSNQALTTVRYWLIGVNTKK